MAHEITLAAAAVMTKDYREAGINFIKASAFEKSAFERILAQEGCVGIRLYYALTNETTHPGEEGGLTVVMAGYDKDGNDLYQGELAEMTSQCPFICPAQNPLNASL